MFPKKMSLLLMQKRCSTFEIRKTSQKFVHYTMEYKYCWRCKMEVPMLDKEEYAIASQLYTRVLKF